MGTGFHPDPSTEFTLSAIEVLRTRLTGRENIYLNGAILGMRRTETCAELSRSIASSTRLVLSAPKHRRLRRDLC